MHGSYLRFFLMVGTSTVIMYGLMYLNTYSLDHVAWSETRLYMACLMGAVMALVMLAFMRHMYNNRTANLAIAATSVAVLLGSPTRSSARSGRRSRP
ncbi:MAG: hypothetical protein K0S48_2481 [Ramlibacter sp.]|nr:hypothetical protein [Ramlibacter sp.]MCE3269782.1 hypothetical protein [Ramlibacter sp.]